MNGGKSGTGGIESGTDGNGLAWRLFWPVYGVLVAVICVVNVVNVSSTLIEDPPGHRDFAVWEPWTWEVSSAAGAVGLMPLIWAGYRLLTWRRLGVLRFLAVHAGLMVVYSLLHVAIMVTVRKVVYAAMHSHYDFSHGQLLLWLLYEGRKDMLAYALYLTFYWGAERLSAPEPAPSPGRLEVRADGRTLYLDPAVLTHVEAAGNYVELYRSGDRMLMVRGTLAEFETHLAPCGFVRIHRSRLINRRRIASYEATPAGDLRIVMDDGRELAGSRRYRGNLK